MTDKKIISEPKEAVRVFKNKPGDDSFVAVLETDEIVEINYTNWNTEGLKNKVHDGIVFRYTENIHFTENMLKEVESL